MNNSRTDSWDAHVSRTHAIPPQLSVEEPAPRAGTSQSAADLVPGDVVILNQVPTRILAEPRTVHRGWSLFDEFEIALEVEAMPDVADGESYLVVLKPDQELRVVSAQDSSRHHSTTENGGESGPARTD
jgi:hypothetical protein